jgi:S1-C subfamily serine protease
MFLLVFQIGLIVGSSRQQVENPLTQFTTQDSLETISSSYGFSFSYNKSDFNGSANAINQDNEGVSVPRTDLANGNAITFAQIKPKSMAIPSSLSASQLSVQVEPNKQALQAATDKPANKDKAGGEIAAELLPMTQTTDFDVSTLSQSQEIIGDGAQMLRTTYQFTPKFEGGLSYAISWHGVVDERAIVIKLTGLVTSSVLPGEYAEILDSFTFTGAPKVQGLKFPGIETASASGSLDTKYIADLVSPSVVKIYHVVCGDLVLGTNKYPDTCDGGTGSGAIVSPDGYIATNGHVVVITAKDIFVRRITADQRIFVSFLQGLGYSNTEIAEIVSDSQKLASLIAKIYDLPDTDIFLDQPKEITLVSLGEEPLILPEGSILRDVLSVSDTDSIKSAKVVGADYQSKDLWVAQSGDPTGFSSSDVALLKIDIVNAPSVTINATPVTQNEKIVVLGFPGDAENALVDNSKLDVSVTNGSISAIKDAAGGAGKLYQSDADASQGNSGGPAITQNGEIFGLLTYRVSGDDQGNAAKSYIRDVVDLSDLAKEKSATLGGPSTTMDTWRKGLTLYSQNHFSAAKNEFQKVRDAYSSHRLADDYIDNASKQIAAGNDVPLYSPVLIAVAGIIGLVAVAGAIIVIVRHRAKHQTYLAGNMPTATQPPVAAQSSTTIPQQPTPNPTVAPAAMQGVTAPQIMQQVQPGQAPGVVQPSIVTPQPLSPGALTPQQSFVQPPLTPSPMPQTGVPVTTTPIDQFIPRPPQPPAAPGS